MLTSIIYRNGQNCIFSETSTNFFLKLEKIFCEINKSHFSGKNPFLDSSGGRASDFGSDDPRSNGVPGVNFFFTFFGSNMILSPSGGQIIDYECIKSFFDSKMGLKNTFFYFLSLSIDSA